MDYSSYRYVRASGYGFIGLRGNIQGDIESGQENGQEWKRTWKLPFGGVGRKS